MNSELPFVFEINDQALSDPNRFIVRIPKNIQTVEELHNVYLKLARFPNYYGKNWDAFLDCLCDFSWIKQYKIIIIHEDLPLSLITNEFRTYINI